MSERPACDEFEELLQDAMDRRQDLRRAVGSVPHAEACADCRRLLDGYIALESMLAVVARQALRGSAVPTDAFVDWSRDGRIREWDVGEQVARKRGGGRRQWTMILPKALAFSALLMIGLAAANRNGLEHPVSPGYDHTAPAGPHADSMPVFASSDAMPPIGAPEDELRLADTPPVVLAADSGVSQSIRSALWITDQLTGMPSIRHTAIQAIDWIRNVVPAPPPAAHQSP